MWIVLIHTQSKQGYSEPHQGKVNLSRTCSTHTIKSHFALNIEVCIPVIIDVHSSTLTLYFCLKEAMTTWQFQAKLHGSSKWDGTLASPRRCPRKCQLHRSRDPVPSESQWINSAVWHGLLKRASTIQLKPPYPLLHTTNAQDWVLVCGS